MGFLIALTPGERPGIESDLACEIAERLVSATILRAAGDGRFVDSQGRDVPLERFQVVWCHQGDKIEPKGPLFESQTVAVLRQFVNRGHGLLLSGGAAALVAPLGLDKVRIQPESTGKDGAQAGLMPLNARHPALAGLDLQDGVLWVSNALFPAFVRFHPESRPAQGLVLAKTPDGGPENPLVEYQLGTGRALVLAWRLDPLYGHAADGYRRRCEQLFLALVGYLGDTRIWPPRMMPASGRPQSAEVGPIVPEGPVAIARIGDSRSSGNLLAAAIPAPPSSCSD